VLTQQTTNAWRNLAHPSDVSPSRCRRSVFFSKQQRTRILGCRCASRHHRAIRKDRHEAGLAMKYKCSSASSCSQKRHTRWHVSLYLFVSLSIYRSNSLYIYIYIYLSLSLSLSVYLSICLSVYLSVYVSTHLFLYLSWYLTICLCVYVSICLSRHLFL